MNSRQDRILKVSMSIAVGTMVFCMTVPVVLVLGGILFGSLGWLDGEGLISILIGWIVGIFAGLKYYQHIEKRADTWENTFRHSSSKTMHSKRCG